MFLYLLYFLFYKIVEQKSGKDSEEGGGEEVGIDEGGGVAGKGVGG
jgi:hypothetical protein